MGRNLLQCVLVVLTVATAAVYGGPRNVSEATYSVWGDVATAPPEPDCNAIHQTKKNCPVIRVRDRLILCGNPFIQPAPVAKGGVLIKRYDIIHAGYCTEFTSCIDHYKNRKETPPDAWQQTTGMGCKQQKKE